MNDELNRRYLNRAIASQLPTRGSYIAWKYFPLAMQDSDWIETEVIKAYSSGMTPATAFGSESPLLHTRLGRGSNTYMGAEWREKIIDDAELFRNLRKFGTCDDPQVKASVLNFLKYEMRRRLDARIEWMRWEVLKNSQLTYRPANQTATVTVSYPHPGYLDMTVGTLWTNTAASNPLNDLSVAINEMGDIPLGYSFDVLMTPSTMRLMIQSASINDIGKTLFQNTNVNLSWMEGMTEARVASDGEVASMLERIIAFQLGPDLVHIVPVKSGVDYVSDLATAAAAGAGVLTLNSVEGFKVGQRVTLTDRASGSFHRADITAVTTATNQITLGTAVPAGVNLPVGTQARVRDYFMDDDKVIIVATFDESQLDEEAYAMYQLGMNLELPTTVGRIVSTPNRYFKDDRRPGYFTHMRTEVGEPPHDEFIAGIVALPQINYPELYSRLTVR